LATTTCARPSRRPGISSSGSIATVTRSPELRPSCASYAARRRILPSVVLVLSVTSGLLAYPRASQLWVGHVGADREREGTSRATGLTGVVRRRTAMAKLKTRRSRGRQSERVGRVYIDGIIMQPCPTNRPRSDARLPPMGA
jgi:hypothetical protein